VTDQDSEKQSKNWKLLWWIHKGFIIGLLLSYATTFISPTSFPWLGFFGLAYPFWISFNVIAALFWLTVRKRKRFMFTLVILLLGWNVHNDFFAINTSSEPSDKAIKVLSYNVRVFDLYNWSDGSRSRDSIFNLLDQQSADILCFQEFYHTNKKGVFETRDTLIKFLPTVSYHEKYTHKMAGDQFFGVVTFSRFPIVGKGDIPFVSDQNNFCIYTDLQIDKDTIRVYNAHLASIRFDNEDYQFIRDEEKRNLGAALRMSSRMNLAFNKRAEQTEAILENIKKSPHPVIFCCDFNDSPVSFGYHLLEDELNDAFVEAGSGIGRSYAGDFPSFRIDYMFTSPNIEAVDFEVVRKKFSDHYPIVGIFELPE
jgi:endonuclease/exonuclease/phosphatase family metal-dependent hydrolase